jgi:hypothetical protein
MDFALTDIDVVEFVVKEKVVEFLLFYFIFLILMKPDSDSTKQVVICVFSY